MNKEISTTIEEIVISVNQSYNDIESKNSEGINKFVTEFILLIEKFNTQMKHSENKGDEYCLSFREDVSNLYDYLFIQGDLIGRIGGPKKEDMEIIRKLAEGNKKIKEILKKLDKGEARLVDMEDLAKEIPLGTIPMNEAPAILGKLIAYKQNGNRLNGTERGNVFKKSIGTNFLKEFISNYPAPKSDNESDPVYVLKNESVILKLFEEYRIYFPDETKESWKQRWVNGSESLPQITKNEFKEGNEKHLLLTILNEVFLFIKATPKESYIMKRWGLKSYHQDVSKYLTGKDKRPPHSETNRIRDIIKPEQN